MNTNEILIGESLVVTLNENKVVVACDIMTDPTEEDIAKLETYSFKFVGTPFQVEVWEEIRKIPRGETRTYSQISEAIGSKNSYRAVANACGQNKIAILIPCHRVIGKSSIGGFKWGKRTKEKLLQMERHN